MNIAPQITIDVLGYIWMPRTLASYTYYAKLDEESIAGNIYPFTREAVADWLSKNAGDYSEIVDFQARYTSYTEACKHCGCRKPVENVIPWEDGGTYPGGSARGSLGRTYT